MAYQKHSRGVRLFSAVMRLAAGLQGLPARLTPPPFRLVQMGSAFWQSRALYVAARLDVATVLGDRAMNAEAIAARVAAQPDAVLRLLRFLASLGVFEQCGPASYRNNKVSHYLRTDHPRNVRAMVLMHNSEVMSRPWFDSLESAVREGGIPFEGSHGQPLYQYLSAHPDTEALFAAAMDSVEALTGDSFATDFDWGRFQRLIDVGGSKGSKALAILARHPRLKAVVVDRESVVQTAPDHWRDTPRASLLERLRFEPGDVFAALPPAREGDIYLVAGVLHGFDDSACVRALEHLRQVVTPAGAAIAVLETVMDETRPDAVTTSMDMQMFMGTAGRERTRREWRALMDASGLRVEEEVALRSFVRILLLRA